VVNWHEIKLPSVDVHSSDPCFDSISQPESPARAPPDKRVRLLFEVIEVVSQACHMQETLDRQLHKLAEEPEVLDSDNHRVERFANPTL
jgi:hypothetical protein